MNRPMLATVWLSVLGTLMLFLFPAPVGPYCATHGPVTIIRTTTSLRTVQFKTSAVATSVRTATSKFARSVTSRSLLQIHLSLCLFNPQSGPILRC